jgi:hypothetical protein
MKCSSPRGLSAAIAAILAGTAVPATTALAQAEISRANTGSALFYPYYTVNDGWITTFNLINTLPKTLAVKVRFHEMKNSRDVLDFTIVLSPFDTWTGWVQDSDQGPELRTVDRSCTSPLDVRDPSVPVYASRIAYTGEFDDTGGAGANRMREGYVEVLVMGASDTIANPGSTFDADANFQDKTSLFVPYHAEHVDGEPRDCTIVDRAFIAQSPQWQAPDSPLDSKYLVSGGLPCVYPVGVGFPLSGSGFPLASCDFSGSVAAGNPLKGNVGWLNAATGYGAGSEAIAVANWLTTNPPQINLVTAQEFPWFLEPTFATSFVLWNLAAPSNQADLSAFESSIGASATFNEWANNPNNGARTDWVVSFPTKAFHVDLFNEQIQAAVSRYRNLTLGNTSTVVDCDSDAAADRPSCVVGADAPIPIAPFENLFGVEKAADGTGISAVSVVWDYYDREEGTARAASGGTSISPAPPPIPVEIELLYESNVITFANDSVMGSSFPTPSGVGEALPTATSGWAALSFPNAKDGNDGQSVSGSLIGLPVGAFAIRSIERTLDGQAYDAGYVPGAP